jgi:hypothetical protein
MASKTFNIPFIQGQLMFWSWTTQAANNVMVTLQDSSTQYFNASRQNTDPLPAPIPGASLIGGPNLQLTVNVPAASALVVSTSSVNITDPSGNVIGETFSVAIEDGSDGDFNDVWVSLAAWNLAG